MDTRARTAFVIWIDGPPDGEPDADVVYRGRVEHVPSATRVPFVTREELLSFIERALRGQAEPAEGGED